jgi:ABC-type lipoprotein release transport system permease subunit
MTPLRLALRTLLLGRRRSLAATLVVAGALCGIDLFGGNVASERRRLEYQAVVGERLGHLAIVPARGAGLPAKAFDPGQAQRARRVAEASKGVALVVPQVDVTGIASTGKRSALFVGTGLPVAGDDAPAILREQPGKLKPHAPKGIAVSSGQARSLGLSNGSAVTLTGVAPNARPVPFNAQVIDIFNTAGFDANARSVLMPFELAQSLLDAVHTERLAVFLVDPVRLEASRAALAQALRSAGVAAEVRSWQELSASYAARRRESAHTFACVAAIMLALVAAAVGATMSMNALERRRELATLRALGMGRGGVFATLAAEALWIGVAGVLLGMAASGVVAWVVNRAALSYATQPSLSQPPMLVELDLVNMLAAVGAVLAAALLAALLPAINAARGDVAAGLAYGSERQGW